MSTIFGRAIGLGCATTLLLLLQSCADMKRQAEERSRFNYAEVSTTSLPDQAGPCKSLLQLKYHLRNGENPKIGEYSSKSLVLRETRDATDSEIVELDDERFSQGAFVHQSRPYTCFAAALATIWSAQYRSKLSKEDEFIDISRKACGIGLSHPVSLLELINTINLKVTGNEFDFIRTNSADVFNAVASGSVSSATCRQFPIIYTADGGQFIHREGCSSFQFNVDITAALFKKGFQAVNMSQGVPPSVNLTVSSPSLDGNLYKPVEWSRNNQQVGGIYPVATTAELVMHAMAMHYLLIGLQDDSPGHTMIVSGIRYKPDARINKQGAKELLANTEILEMRLLDPSRAADPQRWEKVSGQDFFRKIDFILALDLPKQQ